MEDLGNVVYAKVRLDKQTGEWTNSRGEQWSRWCGNGSFFSVFDLKLWSHVHCNSVSRTPKPLVLPSVSSEWCACSLLPFLIGNIFLLFQAFSFFCIKDWTFSGYFPFWLSWQSFPQYRLRACPTLVFSLSSQRSWFSWFSIRLNLSLLAGCSL